MCQLTFYISLKLLQFYQVHLSKIWNIPIEYHFQNILKLEMIFSESKAHNLGKNSSQQNSAQSAKAFRKSLHNCLLWNDRMMDWWAMVTKLVGHKNSISCYILVFVQTCQPVKVKLQVMTYIEKIISGFN